MSNKLSLRDYLIIGGLIFSGSVCVLSPSLNSIALYFVIPLIFLSAVLYNKGLRSNKYQKYIVLLCILDFVSGLWASSSMEYNREIKQMLGVFLVTYIFSIYSKREQILPFLYLTFVALIGGCIIYASNNIVMSSELMSGAEQRLHDKTLDANTFAYYTFFCTFLIFILEKEVKTRRNKSLLRFLFLSMIPFSFIIALLTASRQILIIQIPLCALLLYVRYLYYQSINKKITYICFCAILMFVVLPSTIDVYQSSYLSQRAEVDVKEDSRFLLLKDATKIGWENFPFGVGAGNYIVHSFNKHFSHCTYTELWANLGILGVLVYVKLLFAYLKKQWKRFKTYKDRTYLSFLIFGLIFAFHNVFYVFYTGLWLMGFFILVASHSEIYYQKHQQQLMSK